MSSHKVTISRYECAQLLGISVRLLDKCIAKGEIKAIRLGDRVLRGHNDVPVPTIDGYEDPQFHLDGRVRPN
jgi:excisionase family DNA binding protein